MIRLCKKQNKKIKLMDTLDHCPLYLLDNKSPHPSLLIPFCRSLHGRRVHKSLCSAWQKQEYVSLWYETNAGTSRTGLGKNPVWDSFLLQQLWWRPSRCSATISSFRGRCRSSVWMHVGVNNSVCYRVLTKAKRWGHRTYKRLNKYNLNLNWDYKH